jgi:uncharacterized protein (DUF2126 family)
MSIRVALHHSTHYRYDRPIDLGPQVVRLRPAAHARTPVLSYSLQVTPQDHFINWQQDPHGNYLARLVFPKKVREFRVDVDLIADMTVINPFDFFLEPAANEYPFAYDADMRQELESYLRPDTPGPAVVQFLTEVDRTKRRTIDFLVDLNQQLHQAVGYVIRMEPGIQTCEETLTKRTGSCRDSAFVLVQLLRHLGFAARFTSGYLIQLKPDEKPLDGPAGAVEDFTDLHAWTEVYLPGAGWIGLDPTSGLLAGEGHIPLACTPNPQSAAPISGALEPCETEFQFAMQVTRVQEEPRVTKPYSEEQWARIEALGREVDRQLVSRDVRLTMGGEPTFVSIDDMQGEEWRTAAMGPHKRRLGHDLLLRLRRRFAPGGLLHLGQGKWYPGEPLPRWAFRCYWRKDGQPLWRDASLLADDNVDYGHTAADAQRFLQALAGRLGMEDTYVQPAYEDALYYIWKEQQLPHNVDWKDNKLEDELERRRLARVFQRGLTNAVGSLLPIQFDSWSNSPGWRTSAWVVRTDRLFLLPGDSPLGLRLPLQSLSWAEGTSRKGEFYPPDPMAERSSLPPADRIRDQMAYRRWQSEGRREMWMPQLVGAATNDASRSEPRRSGPGGPGSFGPSSYDGGSYGPGDDEWFASDPRSKADSNGPAGTVRTAICAEPRQGRLHVFMPPLDRVEAYLDLVTSIEDTAHELEMPVVIEGYLPPGDPRLCHFSVTPDPGVIEVNVQPAGSWDELTNITEGVYADARQSRLGTEKFELDGTHTGTGGGNHIVLGGPTPADSPFLRRPDLLRSLLGYWHNHPSLSYLFSGRFVGPTSQAPRVDEGRRDAVYELQIAFEQIPDGGSVPPWLVDRVFRHLLVDGTGNTHRAEFCIDKLFSPDSASGRLGLVEFRSFEMPPHYRMSLAQQLLMRALVARFWEQPYRAPLQSWNTSLHDRFMLPHFLSQDFTEVLRETNDAGYAMDVNWFHAHFEFRFPKIGEATYDSVQIELRQAMEPWYVLGEEPAGGGVARFVDSSVERLQVRVRGMADSRHVVTCNGRRVPLHPTGTEGEFVAGVRYRAWQPPSCLHPTIPVDEPLVFDLLDLWSGRSLGGCRYHVGHPGGLNPSVFPVNAYEAESRRACRFFRMGHTAGSMNVPREEPNPHYPFTLDLRRSRGN